MSRRWGQPGWVALVGVRRQRERVRIRGRPSRTLLVEPPGGPHAVLGGTSAHGRQGRGGRRAAACPGAAGVPGVRGSAGPVGVCAAAGAARAGRGAAAAPAPPGAVRRVRAHARAAAGGRAGAAGGRGAGDRRGPGSQGGRAWAPAGRGVAGPPGGDGAGLAAPVRLAGRAAAGGVHDAAVRAGPGPTGARARRIGGGGCGGRDPGRGRGGGAPLAWRGVRVVAVGAGRRRDRGAVGRHCGWGAGAQHELPLVRPLVSRRGFATDRFPPCRGGEQVPHADDEQRRRAERARRVALFRYELIQDVIDPVLSSRQRGRLIRALAERDHPGAFEALVPAPARVSARTPAEVLALAAALKRERPERTAAQVARILRAQSGWAPSERTLQRHFVRLELDRTVRADPVVFGRFEADRPNELWTGDALHGPVVGGRKTFLFCFLDDHSRAVMGARFGYHEDTVWLAAALRPALASRGVSE